MPGYWTTEDREADVRRITREAIERCADIAQHFQPDAQFEDADPRMLALLKIAISDHIRNTLGGGV